MYCNKRLKYLIFIFMVGIFFYGVAIADAASNKRVAVIIDAPVFFVDHEVVRKEVAKALKTKLEKNNYTMISFAGTQEMVKIYQVENMDTMFLHNLCKKDMQQIVKPLQADYILYLQLSTSQISSMKFFLTWDIRLLDVHMLDYLFCKSMTKENIKIKVEWIKDFDELYQVYLDMLLQCLDECEIDNRSCMKIIK